MSELKYDEPVIYVGPNLLSLGVMQFQVYSDGLPEFVKRAVQRIPEIKALIVPVEELEKTRSKLDDAGTYENRIFKKIQKASDEMKRAYKIKK